MTSLGASTRWDKSPSRLLGVCHLAASSLSKAPKPSPCCQGPCPPSPTRLGAAASGLPLRVGPTFASTCRRPLRGCPFLPRKALRRFRGKAVHRPSLRLGAREGAPHALLTWNTRSGIGRDLRTPGQGCVLLQGLLWLREERSWKDVVTGCVQGQQGSRARPSGLGAPSTPSSRRRGRSGETAGRQPFTFPGLSAPQSLTGEPAAPRPGPDGTCSSAGGRARRDSQKPWPGGAARSPWQRHPSRDGPPSSREIGQPPEVRNNPEVPTRRSSPPEDSVSGPPEGSAVAWPWTVRGRRPSRPVGQAGAPALGPYPRPSDALRPDPGHHPPGPDPGPRCPPLQPRPPPPTPRCPAPRPRPPRSPALSPGARSGSLRPRAAGPPSWCRGAFILSPGAAPSGVSSPKEQMNPQT